MDATQQRPPARRGPLRVLFGAPLDWRTWTRAGYLLAALPIGWGLSTVMVVTQALWVLVAMLAVLLCLAGLTVVRASAWVVWRARTIARDGPSGRELPGSRLLIRLRSLAADPAGWLAPALAVGKAGAALERTLAGVVLGARISRLHRAGGSMRAPAVRPASATAGRGAWRDTAYLVLLAPASIVWAAPLVGLAFAGTVLTWSFWAGPERRLALWALSIPIDTPQRRLVSLVAGLAILVPVASLIRWLGGVRARLARHFLDPSPDAGLAAKLAEQRAMHAAAMRAHASDNRRIERDLHDGAQARLTALIMDLGRAKKKLASDPRAAQPLVNQAYQEARQALAELRNLTRGIQPPILTDRGLDAAISALTARAPLPIDLHVDVPSRPPAPVETAAYFIVAEALTNIAKHARASRARVQIIQLDNRLVVEVSDDGVGGARPTGGTGLSGLSDRAVALDGRLTISSPPGGPTTVQAELPCAW